MLCGYRSGAGQEPDPGDPQHWWPAITFMTSNILYLEEDNAVLILPIGKEHDGIFHSFIDLDPSNR